MKHGNMLGSTTPLNLSHFVISQTSSNLIIRAFESSSKQMADVVLFEVLLKQVVAMIDAVEVLLSAGIAQPAYLPSRAAIDRVTIWSSATDDQRLNALIAGALLANLRALRAGGSMSLLDDAEVAGRPATVLDIVGNAGATVAGVHRYKVWLAQDTLFPLRVESFAAGDSPIETVDMADVETDVTFPERFLTP
jgi:hypothetical protein